jgi:hypothetical protein
MSGLVIYKWFDFDFVLLGSMSCTLLAIVLILTVNFPFRSPQDDVPLVSLDRFFLPRSFPLFANLLLVSTIVGLLLSLGLTVLAIVLNFFSANGSAAWGIVAWWFLLLVSTPMVCSQIWVISLFLWAFLLMGTITCLRKK